MSRPVELVDRRGSAARPEQEAPADRTRLPSTSHHPVAAPEPMSLRWLLVHLVEETGRQAGHADDMREQLDGAFGR